MINIFLRFRNLIFNSLTLVTQNPLPPQKPYSQIVYLHKFWFEEWIFKNYEADIIKNPLTFEFLGLPVTALPEEDQLEKELITTCD